MRGRKNSYQCLGDFNGDICAKHDPTLRDYCPVPEVETTTLLAQPEERVAESGSYMSVMAGVSAAAVGLVLTACLAKRKAVAADDFQRA